MNDDPIRNIKDPLRSSSPDMARELFRILATSCKDVPNEVVLGAAANLIINSIRQASSTAYQAEVKFDELFGKSKQALMNHYDSFGRKKGIFPYDQTIHVSLIKDTKEH